MKRSILFLMGCLISVGITAQKSTISGVIIDATTEETLIGATIAVGEDAAAITDFDGRYELTLENGQHTLIISYVGFDPQEINIKLDKNQTLDIKMESRVFLKEIFVSADIAMERKTPVAFSNIPTRKLAEELSAQDIPMVLNSTPGAYATQSGGGDGDARITIRGFNQRNIAVMLDGIPVNDMENGWVFWSNWFGLDLVTQTMQVQRGLGASKLSVPSVGGTINILTKGIDAKKSIKFKQEIGNNGFFRSTFGLTTGRMKNGWGISAAGSYKEGDGWVDGNFTKGYFYYLRVDKQLGNHLLSLSGFGAPQEHGQRPFTTEIGQIDADNARELGVSQEDIDGLVYADEGRRFNEHWGYKRKFNDAGEEIGRDLVNTRKNYYHKPQFSLRHSWQASDRLFWSNIAYLSIGNGGGTADDGADIPRDTTTGAYLIDEAIAGNDTTFFNPNGLSNTILRSSRNNHFWYGLLSTLKYQLRDNISISGGIDARYYRGDHNREVYDLLGGSGYAGHGGNARIDLTNVMLQKGDIMDYNYSGFVRQGGLFGLVEFEGERISAFFNVSTAVTSYKLVDYFREKVVDLGDTTLFISYADTVNYNNQTYTLSSPEAKNQTIDWIDLYSYTFKGGLSYKMNEDINVFANTGYLNKGQRYNNVIDNNRDGDAPIEFTNYSNEEIFAFELGASYKSPIFSANLNTYYTIWLNKPVERAPTVALDPSDPESDRIPVNIPGIDAVHKGIELDFVFKPFKKLAIEGLASVGDWTWNSGETATIILPNENITTFDFDAKGVHVGDAAQLQLGGLIRLEPIKGLYVKLKGTYFDNNYANFQPEDLKGDDARRDSWKMPSYEIFSFHTGYSFKVEKIGYCQVRMNILNLFDKTYISDARNNDTFNSPSYGDFDAKSASVHFAQGRRWTASFQVSF